MHSYRPIITNIFLNNHNCNLNIKVLEVSKAATVGLFGLAYFSLPTNISFVRLFRRTYKNSL